MRGATGGDHDPPIAGGLAAAIAEGLTTLDRVYVEHGRAHREGPPITQPQLGADPGPEGDVGMTLAKLRQLGCTQMRDPDRVVEPGRNRVEHEALRFGVPATERQVDADPFDLQASIAGQIGGLLELRGREAMTLHRGQLLQQHSTLHLLEIDEPPDRVDDPVGLNDGRAVVSKGPPRVEYDEIATEIGDCVKLGVGADSHRVCPQCGGLFGQAAQPEAIAIALCDRHHATASENRGGIGPPALLVDMQGEAHQRRLM